MSQIVGSNRIRSNEEFMKTAILGLILLFNIGAFAHPVSYKGATGIMSYNSPEMNELLVTYSFNFNYAAAVTYLRDSKSEFAIPRFNYLVKRWNNPDSQGNIYLSGGIGSEKFNDKTYGVRLAEFIADWEDRRYYTYFEHLNLTRDNDQNVMLPDQSYNHTKMRLGYAPFLGDYNDLNVWTIVQFEKHNEEKQIEATPFLRFFIKNVLWEVGAGFDGSTKFNFMIHL